MVYGVVCDAVSDEGVGVVYGVVCGAVCDVGVGVVWCSVSSHHALSQHLLPVWLLWRACTEAGVIVTVFIVKYGN